MSNELEARTSWVSLSDIIEEDPKSKSSGSNDAYVDSGVNAITAETYEQPVKLERSAGVKERSSGRMPKGIAPETEVPPKAAAEAPVATQRVKKPATASTTRSSQPRVVRAPPCRSSAQPVAQSRNSRASATANSSRKMRTPSPPPMGKAKAKPIERRIKQEQTPRDGTATDVSMKDVGNQKQPGSMSVATSIPGGSVSNGADPKRRVHPTKTIERVPKPSGQGDEMGLKAVRSEEVFTKSTPSSDTGQVVKVQSLKVVRAQVVPPPEATITAAKPGKQMVNNEKMTIMQDKQHTVTLHCHSTNLELTSTPQFPAPSSDNEVATSSSRADPTLEIQQLKNEVAEMQRSMKEERKHREALCKENVDLIRRVAALDAELTLSRSVNEACPPSSPPTEQRDAQDELRKTNMHLTQLVKELDHELGNALRRSGTWTPVSSLPTESEKVTATLFTVANPLVESTVPESIGESTPTHTPTAAPSRPSTAVVTPVTGIHEVKSAFAEEKPTTTEVSSAKLAMTDEIRFPSTRSSSPQYICPFPISATFKQPYVIPLSPKSSVPQRMASCPTPATPVASCSTSALRTMSPGSVRSCQGLARSVSHAPASVIEARTGLASRYNLQCLKLEVMPAADTSRNSVMPPVAFPRATGISTSPQRSRSTEAQPRWGRPEVQSLQLSMLGMTNQTHAGAGTSVAITRCNHNQFGPSKGVMRYAHGAEHNYVSLSRQQPAMSGWVHRCASPGAAARSLSASPGTTAPGSPHLTSAVRSSSQRRE